MSGSDSFVENLTDRKSGFLSKKIAALESSGFSPDEINEVLKRLGSIGAVGSGRPSGAGIGSWLLNYALPSAVILGTGVLFYLLTGGEDEPPAPVEPTPLNSNCANARNDIGDEEQIDNQNYNEGTMMSAQRRPLQSATVPSSQDTSAESTDLESKRQRDDFFGEASAAWLQELLLTTTTMAADVRVIKEEIERLKVESERAKLKAEEESAERAATATATAEAEAEAVVVPTVPVISLTTEDYLSALETSFKDMMAEHLTGKAAGSAPEKIGAEVDKSEEKTEVPVTEEEESFKKGCGALMMYVGKLLDNPSLPRYRKISTSNVSFKSLVQPLQGHSKVLAAVGFKVSGTGGSSCFEWTWQSDPEPVAGSKEETKAVSTRSKPASDASRTEILTECMRLLEMCKSKGSSALKEDFKSKAAAVVVEKLVESISSDAAVPAVVESSPTDYPSSSSVTVTSVAPSPELPPTDTAVEEVIPSVSLTQPASSDSTLPTPPAALRFNDIMRIVSSTKEKDNAVKSETTLP